MCRCWFGVKAENSKIITNVPTSFSYFDIDGNFVEMKQGLTINILEDIKGILIMSTKKYFLDNSTKNVTRLNRIMIILGISDSL